MLTEPTEGFGHFLAVVEAGNISAAARELDMPRATLSRRISELEASLGVQLLHRTTRRLVPTAAGLELHRRSRVILQDALEARDAVRRLDGIPRGLLRLAILPSLGTALEPLISDYMERYSETQIEVLAGAKLVNLVEQGVDVAIRAGLITDPYLVVHEVGYTDVYPVAAPGYLSKHGSPRKASELKAHVCLLDYQGGNVPRLAWPLKDGGEVSISGRLVSNDLSLLLAAAVAGRGIALLPTAVSWLNLSKGDLKPVLREQICVQSPLSLVHTSREFVDPKVRAFVELAIPFLKNHMEVEQGSWH
jgi:DNA-binding transcriptional LysR family regulator